MRLYVPVTLLPLLHNASRNYPNAWPKAVSSGRVPGHPGVRPLLARRPAPGGLPGSPSLAGQRVRTALARQPGLDRRHPPDPGDAGEVRGGRRTGRARLRAGRTIRPTAGSEDLGAVSRELLDRCGNHHYASAAEGVQLRARGYRVGMRGDVIGCVRVRYRRGAELPGASVRAGRPERRWPRHLPRRPHQSIPFSCLPALAVG